MQNTVSLGAINKEKGCRDGGCFRENISTKEMLFSGTSEILLYTQISVGFILSHSWLFLKARP